MSKFRPEITFHGIPVGLEIRKSIGHLITWRKRPRIQDKYYYSVPTNPRSDAQQRPRYKFRHMVAFAQLLTSAERAYWTAINKNRGTAPWFLNFMSHVMSSPFELVRTATRPQVIAEITEDEYTFPEADLSAYVPPGTTMVYVEVFFSVRDAPRSPCWWAPASPRGGFQIPHRNYEAGYLLQPYHLFIDIYTAREIRFEVYTDPGNRTEFRVTLEGYVAPSGA